MKKIMLIGFSALLGCSCSNELAISPDYAPGWQPPVVTGIELMDQDGAFRGVWGYPAYPSQSHVANATSRFSGALNMRSPFPNPSFGGPIRFEMAIPSRSTPVAWITPARWVDEPISNVTFNEGQLLLTADGARAYKIFWDGSEEISAGYHAFSLDKGTLPSGFYRFYLKIEKDLLWRDFYIAYVREDIPADLVKYFPDGP